MLVLSRRVDESIHIGDDITITIKAINGDLVDISVKTPEGLTVTAQGKDEYAKKASRIKKKNKRT